MYKPASKDYKKIALAMLEAAESISMDRGEASFVEITDAPRNEGFELDDIWDTWGRLATSDPKVLKSESIGRNGYNYSITAEGRRWIRDFSRDLEGASK